MARAAQAKRSKDGFLENFDFFVVFVFVVKGKIRTRVLAIRDAVSVCVFILWIKTKSLLFNIRPAVFVLLVKS